MTGLRWACRILLALVALGGLLFALTRIPAELEADPIVALAEKVVAGSDYDVKSLARLEPHLAAAERDTRCGPTRGPLAAIRSYQVQQAAIEGDVPRAQESGRAAIRNLRLKLACSPEDGLSWFTLFLMESSLSGRARANLPFLLQSYKVAPNEGQLMRSRSQVASALLPLVGPELQGYIRAEFVHMARDDGLSAVSVLLGSGEELRALLIPLLAEVGVDQRKEIAARLAYEGSDIVVPGVPKL